jgi:hypothetical protein
MRRVERVVWGIPVGRDGGVEADEEFFDET